MAGSEAPFGARIYFLPNGSIFVRQTKLGNGGVYHLDDWRGGVCKLGDAARLMSLVEAAREGKLPPCDGHGEALRRIEPTAIVPAEAYIPFGGSGGGRGKS